MRPPLSYVPLLPLLPGIVAGILLYEVSGGMWIAFGAGMSGVVMMAFRHRTAALALIAVTVGAMASYLSDSAAFGRVPEKGTMMEGRIVEWHLRDYGQSVVVDVDNVIGPCQDNDWKGVKGEVTLPFFTPQLSPGDRIEFGGSYSHACIETDFPMEDDLSENYRRRGISFRCYSPEDSVKVIGTDASLYYRIKRLREEGVECIYRSGVNDETAEMLAAVLLGDDDDLDRERRDIYGASGVAHLLALSGAHVAVITAILGVILWPLALVRMRKVRWVIIALALWLYAVMTGMSPSVVRSVIMASAVLIAMIIDRPRSSVNALILAAILILVFSPSSLYMTGFQLSFVATLAIILMAPQLTPGRMMTGLRLGMAAIAVAFAATIGTMPLVAYHFHRLPLLFIPANLIAAGVMPLLMAGGGTLIVLEAAGMGQGWLVEMLDLTVMWFDRMVGWMSSAGIACIDRIYFSPWLLIPLYMAIGAAMAYGATRRLQYGLMSLLLVAFAVTAGIMTQGGYACDDIIVGHNRQWLELYIHRGDTLEIVTTAVAGEHDAIAERVRERARDFIATRGIQTVEVTSAAQDGSTTVVDGCGARIAIIASHKPAIPFPHCQYALVTKGFRGDISDLASVIGSDTILLGADINRRRRSRFLSELRESGVPAIDTSEHTFILSSRR